MRTEGTQIRPKESGQHVNPLVNEVHRRPTRSGLAVHWSVRMDEVRHIGNVCHSDQHPGNFACEWNGLTDASLDVPVGETACMQRIVDILAA